jgi:hypothetical protein
MLYGQITNSKKFNIMKGVKYILKKGVNIAWGVVKGVYENGFKG